MKTSRSLFLLAVLWQLAPAALAADLSGFWQHEEKPAWIEIQFKDGTGIGKVVRNDEYPDRVGRVLLKEISADGDDGANWRGQVYAERLEEFKDAEISLPEPDQMQIKVKVGFMSRTVTWKRVSEIAED